MVDDDPLVEQARRRAAVLEGKPFVAPDDGGVDGERVAAAEPEAAAHVERAARRRKRRLDRPVAQPVAPVGRVVVVEDDVRVVRLGELADVLNRDEDPAGVGVSRAEADAALRRAGWRARWERPVDIVDSVE